MKSVIGVILDVGVTSVVVDVKVVKIMFVVGWVDVILEQITVFQMKFIFFKWYCLNLFLS